MAVDFAAKQQREPEGGYGRKGRLSALWAECGLEEIEETDLVISVDFASYDEFWLPHLEGQGHAGSYVRGLPPDRQEALRERLRHDLLGMKGDGPFPLRSQAMAVRGMLPT